MLKSVKQEVLRLLQVVIGLLFYAFGIYLSVQANVGLAPWEAFHMGLSYKLGWSMGTVSIVVSVMIVVLDFALGEKIGVGSVLNALLIGAFLDAYFWLDWIPLQHSVTTGIPLLLLGIFTIACSTYLYIKPALGAGPRDALMVLLSRRFPTLSIGMIRSAIEAVVLLIGWWCGAKIGIGTVLAVLAFGICIAKVFAKLNFDPKGVAHESVQDTLTRWKKRK